MRKLQFQNLSHIVCDTFIVWKLYKQGLWSPNFTLKNGMSHLKGLTQNKKKNYAQFELPTSPTYLFTQLSKCLVWPTHLGWPMYLPT